MQKNHNQIENDSYYLIIISYKSCKHHDLDYVIVIIFKQKENLILDHDYHNFKIEKLKITIIS